MVPSKRVALSSVGRTGGWRQRVFGAKRAPVEVVPTSAQIPQECTEKIRSGVDQLTTKVEELTAEFVNSLKATDRLSVLLHELSEGRADNRESLSALLTLLSAMGALFGVVFYVIFGTKTAYRSIPTPVWAFLPAIPFGLTGFLIYVGTQASLRSEYLVRLERLVWAELERSILIKREGGGGRDIPVPAFSHLLMPLIRTNIKGHRGSLLLVLSGVSILLGSLAVLIVTAALAAHGWGWKVGIATGYGLYFIFATYRVLIGTGASGKVWKIAVEFADIPDLETRG